MCSLQKLPLELKEDFIFAVETRKDLVHLALTCREFYKMIVPTYHILFARISCSPSQPHFWQHLSTSHRLFSMVRQLEIRHDPEFFSPSWLQARSVTDEAFIKKWTNSPTPSTVSEFEYFLKCLPLMDHLNAVFIYDDLLQEFNAALVHLSKNFRHHLKTLEILVSERRADDSSDCDIPRQLDCSFQCLTSFSLVIIQGSLTGTTKLVLASLILNCSTLVDFALISYLHELFPCQHLLKKATWPSLKRLTLDGPLYLFDFEDSPKRTNLIVSFFLRHPSLTCLYVPSFPEIIDACIANQKTPISSLFPSLRSLDSAFPIGPDFLGLLTHLSTSVDESSIEDFTSASSLQSCVLHVPDSATFEEFVESVSDKFERLSLHYYFTCPISEDCTVDCECSLDGILSLVTQLQNLTHLELYMGEASEDIVEDLFGRLIKDLPRLTFCRVWSEDLEDEWYFIKRNQKGKCVGQATPLGYGIGESFHSSSWGNFYNGLERAVDNEVSRY